MPPYRYKAGGRFPLYPSRQDPRFFRSLNSSPPPGANHHPKPPKTRPIVRLGASFVNIIAYIPRRLYCRAKFHSRNRPGGIKGAHSVVSPPAMRGIRITSGNMPGDERVSSSGSDTVVGSSIYSDANNPLILPPSSNANNTILHPTTNEPQQTLTQSAQTFADNATNDFHHRLASGFHSDTVHSLDEYVQMGQFGSLEETLWERKE